MPRELLWLNGRITPLDEARISPEDRGFLFADGIYEVIRFYGGRPFLLREHLERWERSARGILLDSPGTPEERAERIRGLVDEADFGDCYAYGQLTRGAAPRNHAFPEDPRPTELWVIRPAKGYPPECKELGVSLLPHPDERWARCDLKTVSLLPNCLAKERARRAGCFEALLYREDGTVTECAATNACCVRGGVVWTHPLTNRILPGITRAPVLRLAREAGIEVREEAVTLDEFRAADEAFLTSTTMEVMPVTRLEATPIGDGRVGPVTRRLMALMRGFVEESTLA